MNENPIREININYHMCVKLVSTMLKIVSRRKKLTNHIISTIWPININSFSVRNLGAISIIVDFTRLYRHISHTHMVIDVNFLDSSLIAHKV